MTLPTNKFRHVWRNANDGLADVNVLALQQYHEAEGWEHIDIVSQGGYWEDIPISITEENNFPYEAKP